MADRWDVAGRLDEGRLAVERTQNYVSACHAVGYSHPELTEYPSQVRDRYDDEDGLDLLALDRDCTDLRAAGSAADEAARLQRAQVSELAAAWTGPGGDAAVRFVQRHCEAANAVAAELRAAAQRCESLRDNLWLLVDAKVATAVALDDRSRAQRPTWLAAATTVTTGVGDRQTAEGVVREQVVPYVDNDIRDEWLTAMRSTTDGVRTSYAMVIDRMAAAPTVRFEFPGGLLSSSPAWQPIPCNTPPPAPVRAASAAPAPTVDSVPTPPVDPASWAAAAPEWAAALGDAARLPTNDGVGLGDGGLSGGGLGDGAVGGGLIGLAGRLVNAVGDLIGGPGNADALDGDPFGEAPTGDEPIDDDPTDGKPIDDDPTDGEPIDHDPTEGKPIHDDPTDDADKPAPPESVPPESVPPESVPAPAGEEPGPPATPEAVPPHPVEPAPAGKPAPPTGEAATPCQIAADQLPQAGQ